ncbi:MAG: DNA polymerase III delta prime subunit [Parcubacteria bacterium C7867-002]|nr:MAG: DNA polymerase III delta prime subunit [Parcubacteria bacterium C7867-002]
MKLSFSLPYLSHHSHYLIGSDILRAELKTVLEDVHEIASQGNPDFFDAFYETFTIDDSRQLREMHGVRPVHSSGKKIFIISMDGITIEAQNALLKLLEEPAEYAYFFLIIPSGHLLLPTVKSRMIPIETASEKETTGEGEKFLKLSVAKRLDMIKGLLDDISKEKKTKQHAIQLLHDIEAALYTRKGVAKAAAALRALDIAKKYSSDRAPSLKMLLESVALSV